MDPRQPLSRTPSSSVPQGTYNTNNMASAYAMPPYQSNTHLPPINYPQLPPTNQQGYMQQQPYRNDLPRYNSGPAPAPTQSSDRYNPHMAPQPSMSGLPPNSMLPQPHNQAPQGQSYPNPQQSRSNYPQPLAPAPPRSNIDPLSGAYGQPDNRQPAWSGAENMPSMTSEVGRDPTRTHVVGSQGRRGILPSAPGRAPVMPNGLNGSPKGNAVPQKDADGKFPCPNCTKTYLHAKHLKRHMLRHTGDRPYMCVLCNDTFSRSDILKRHFQKCSVRRGNPTGASHLSNPAAHLKKSQAAAAKAATGSPASATTPVSNGMPNGPFTSAAMPSSSIPTTAGGPNSSMPYSVGPNGQADMQRPGQNQQMQGGAPQGGMDPNAGNQWSMHNARNPQMMYHSTSASPDHFGMQATGGDDKRNVMGGAHHMGDEWNQMFPAGGNESYMNPMFAGYDQSQNDGKKEYEAHEGGSNGYYIPSTSLGADGTLGSPLWNLNSVSDDSFQIKANRLIDFCLPGGIQVSLQEQQNNLSIRSCLTVDAINHFLDLFSTYQGRFPWLHLPTFNFTEAYDGLILVIICSGAVYSDRISQNLVRLLLLRVKYGIERTSKLLNNTSTLPLTMTSTDYEELLSIHMLYSLFVWHGFPEDRANAQGEIGRVHQLTRQFGMLTTTGPEDTSSYSYLHNLAPGERADPGRWNWLTWVEQEKRSRLMFSIFLVDAGMCIFFNARPNYSPSEIKLPLPCDDAAWEASNSEMCAQALGLCGPSLQSKLNITGSLRLKQLEMHHAMSALHSTVMAIQPRTTNVYAKYILIHALHVQIWQIQRQRFGKGPAVSPVSNFSSSQSEDQVNLMINSTETALSRWKQCWDQDLMLQYPPYNRIDQSSHRIGFCRDGIQFYWLALASLPPNRAHDCMLPPHDRFKLVLSGLKKAREWSRTDHAQPYEELGSVACIDDSYVRETLESDMRKLFRPIAELSMTLGIRQFGLT